MIDRLTAALADRYSIERPLGEGGMATVYLADDLKHHRKVAIKVLKPELAAVIGAERFLAEIRTTANLQHPHILPLFDSGEADSFLFYVMPYIEGESLRGMMDRERQLAVDDSVRIAKAIASALDYAHRHDVIHRDIKPENILIHDGNPVVADFGIALAVSAAGGGRMTETGLSLGTPHYMSPEQASADRDLSNRSDIYSLGCMLYEMLAGQPPHTGPSAQSVLVRILTEEPRSLVEERRSVPPHIAAAVSKAIEKLPADRFATAEEFSKALEDKAFTYTAPMRVPTGVMTGVRPAASSGPAAPRWRRALPWAAAVVGLGLGVAGWMLGGGAAEPAAFDLHVGEADLSVGFPLIEVAPDGSVYGVMATLNGERTLLARRRGEADFRVLVRGVVGYFAFSPDGNWIAYEDVRDRSIKRISVDGGTANTLMDAENHRPSELFWGDDGYIVFYSGGQGIEAGAYRVPEVGGPPELVHAGGWIYNPRSLPGGRGYLLTNGSSNTVTLLAPGEDSVRVIIPEGLNGQYIVTGHIAYGHPDGGLQVVPFDLDALEVTGTPVPVRDDVSVDGEYAYFSASRDGTLAYFRGVRGGFAGSDDELVRMNIETGVTEPYPLSPRDIVATRLSPDGRYLVFTVRENDSFDETEAWVYDLELRTSPRRLTFDGRNREVVWAPSGDRVAISRTPGSGGDIELFLKNPADDSAPARVELPEGSRLFAQDWFAPDSLLMRGRLDGEGTADLFVASVDGGEPRLYLSSENNLVDARVAPSGGYVLYLAGVEGGRELIVRRFPDPGQPIPIAARYFAETNVFLSNPRWSPTEPVIYYRATGQGVDSLFAAHVRFEPSFALDSTRLVRTTEGRFGTPELAPDGTTMVVARTVTDADEDDADEEAPPPRAIVVLNWFQELRARLGGR